MTHSKIISHTIHVVSNLSAKDPFSLKTHCNVLEVWLIFNFYLDEVIRIISCIQWHQLPRSCETQHLDTGCTSVGVSSILDVSLDFPMEDLSREQQEDPEIGPIFRWKQESPTKPTWREVNGFSLVVGILWGQWHLLEILQGVLHWVIMQSTGKRVK